MSDNVENAVPQILQSIQRQIADLRVAMDERFEKAEARNEARFNHIDEVLRKQRRDNAGLLVMAKSLSGNFTEELTGIEERVAALESRDAAR